MIFQTFMTHSSETLQRDKAPNLEQSQQMSCPSSGKIVVLNGFPGTGKLTVLKHLQKYLPTETCLLDNHLLIDPVVTVIPDRSDRHHELRRSIRAPIFEELAHRAKQGHTILMTACLAAGSPRDEAVFREHLDIARKAQVPIYWINVHCHRSVLEQRISTPERQQGSKTKLTDVDVLQDILGKHSLLEPSNDGEEGVRLVFESMDVSGEVETSAICLLNIITSAKAVAEDNSAF
jgi:chloramphenicol 3-O-phosphotransferase